MFAGLIVLTLALYHGSLELGFLNLDDPTYVENNRWIREVSAGNVGRILKEPYFANYSPLHILSYMLDYRLAGPDAHGFHLSSVLWAGVVAGFVYLLGVTLLGRWPVALAAAVVFAVHPAHVEAIVWTSSRKDLVAAAFALPATIAYLRYRGGGRRRWAWYGASLVLFVLAIAGKLSVVVLPAILLGFDVVARRRLPGILFDKLPYGVVAVPFVLMTMGAQPSTRHAPDLYVLAHSFVHNLWLLTGTGEYTMLRPRPEPAGVAWQALTVIAAIVLSAVPLLLLWRRGPGPVPALLCWVLLALAPAQVLSFVHPVTDRYLFFPSVAVALLLAWASGAVATRWPGKRPVAVVAVLLVASYCTYRTVAYIGEWRDPRSVWFGAAERSGDVTTRQYLGGHYQDIADGLAGTGTLGAAAARHRAEPLARLWWDGARVAELLAEWRRDGDGPRGEELIAELRRLALVELDAAVEVKRTRVLPNLFYRRGKLALDTGDRTAARAEFRRCAEEAAKHTSARTRHELTVRSHYALGIVAWQEREYDEALEWLQKAEAEQDRTGGHWVPEIRTQRDRLERIMARTVSRSGKLR